jgi:phosphoglycolate phosphatase-like HAD superfamily hydrolase
MKVDVAYFDMDGTIANLYGVENWLDDLEHYRTRPYDEAKVMHNMSALAKKIHKAQKKGIKVGIISWLSKTATDDYNKAVEKAKRKWLKKHLKSVQFDEIHIVPYGTPKSTLATAPMCILFDDEERNRLEWNKGKAYPPEKIFEILEKI